MALAFDLTNARNAEAARAKVVREAIHALATDAPENDVGYSLAYVATYASDATLAKLGRLVR